jgi:hypothetical protein
VLLEDVTIENGIRLIVANLEFSEGGLLQELELAQSQVLGLIRAIPGR